MKIDGEPTQINYQYDANAVVSGLLEGVTLAVERVL